MKFIKYVLIAIYYVLFYVLFAKTDIVFFHSTLFLLSYLGLAPLLLMWIENIKTPKDKIKKSMWYGVWLIVADFILRTIIINHESSSSFDYAIKPAKRMIEGYAWYAYIWDLIKGSLLFLSWITVIVVIIVFIKILISMYKKFIPKIHVSVAKTLILLLSFMGYVYFISVSTLGIDLFASHTFLEMIPRSMLNLFVMYLILLVFFIAASYLKNQSVDIKRIFHLVFIVYLGYVGLLVVFLLNPFFWKFISWLLEHGDTIVSFRYYFSVVIGIVLTITTYITTRYKDERSQDFIFSYKAMVMLIYVAYLIFVLK